MLRTRWRVHAQLESRDRRHVARTWLSIVKLIEGGGDHFWPRPGRILAAARTHTFAQLATAIDGESRVPKDPHLVDLPPLRPGWEAQAQRGPRP